MLGFIPLRYIHAVAWDAIQSLLHSVISFRPGPPALPPQGVPVFVMLPLDTALEKPTIPPHTLHLYLKRLAAAGVQGVMVDVWWRICEPRPTVYDFSSYINLAKTCRSLGLKMQATLSFHSCGGNIGDSVNIPLPEWVLTAGQTHSFWFTDRAGNLDTEYISFGADHEPVLPGADGARPRTPLAAYGAYVAAFVAAMEEEGLMGVTVTELQIGVGPCGELRYPGYQLSRWAFPGIGEFQCFDKYLLANLSDTIREHGSPAVKAATLPPPHTGSYNDTPQQTAFFTSGWRSEPGSFFLKWYSDRLLEHGEDVLRVVRNCVPKADHGVKIAMKISGIHWWRFSPIRAAEATSGYIGAHGRTMYNDICKLMQTYDAVLDFTCLEMRTMDQPMKARCGPRQLVAQVFQAAAKAGVPIAGENALQTFERSSFEQVASAYRTSHGKKAGFTLLRLCDDLMQDETLARLEKFVRDMRYIDASART